MPHSPNGPRSTPRPGAPGATRPVGVDGPDSCEYPTTRLRVQSGRPVTASTGPSDTRARALDLSPPADFPVVPGYEVLGELGRGGMGIVYRARHLDTDRVVALKMINAGCTAEGVARFRSETEVLAELNHPGIVRVYEVGVCPAGPYLAMELAEGGSLTHRLAGAPQPARGAARLVHNLACALEVAHAAGVIHRDLKPGNILLVEGPEVPLERCTPKISDFGLARRLDTLQGLTLSGQVMGTPGYMAPEQAQALPGLVGPATDVYSLGVILYEALTGHPPYRGSTALETVHLMLSADPLPPTRQRRDVPRDLETICLKCLHRDPARRYPTARALADDLDRFLTGRRVLARPVPWPERLAAWARREPAIAALAAVLTLLLTVGLAAVISQWLRAESAHARSLQERDRALMMAESERQARREAQALSARLLLERGVASCESGDYTLGLALLVKGRESAPAGSPLVHAAAALFSTWGRQLHPLRFYHNNGAPISAVTFSHDGESLVYASGREVFRLGALDGVPLGPPTVLPGPVLALRSAPRRVIAVARLSSSRLQAYTVPDGCSAGPPIEFSGELRAVKLSPDGTRLLVGLKDVAQTYTLTTGSRVGKDLPHAWPLRTVAFCPDGRSAVTGDAAGVARLWDLATGKAWFELRGHARAITSVAVCGEGRFVVTGSEDNTARVWRVATGELVHVLPHQHHVTATCFHGPSRLLVTGCRDNTVRAWSVVSGRPIGGMMRHADVISGVALNSQGRLLATASDDGTVRAWKVRRDDQTRPYDHPHAVVGLACHPDGHDFLTVCVIDHVRRWSLTHRQPTDLGAPNHPTRVAYHPRGTSYAVGDYLGGVTVFDAVTGRRRAGPWAHPAPVIALAYSPDGQFIAVGHEDGDRSIVLRDAATGSVVRRLTGHSRKVVSLAFSPNGQRLLSGSWDRTARLWDLTVAEPTGLILRHQDLVQSVAFSPDGELALTGGDDYTARVWEVATGQQRGAPVRHPDKVQTVAFSPDGRLFATAGKGGMVRLWDARTGRLACPPLPHAGEVHLSAFTPDGRFLLTGSWDGKVRRWRVPLSAAGGPAEWRVWLEAHTGQRMDQGGGLVDLDLDSWQRRVRDLVALD